jgi:hypothetical protein
MIIRDENSGKLSIFNNSPVSIEKKTDGEMKLPEDKISSGEMEKPLTDEIDLRKLSMSRSDEAPAGGKVSILAKTVLGVVAGVTMLGAFGCSKPVQPNPAPETATERTMTKGEKVRSTADKIVGGVIGAYGVYETGKGIIEMKNGDKEAAKENLVSGALDMTTGAALGYAGVKEGTDDKIGGVSSSTVGYGVAGAAQAGKFGYKYREPIGEGLTAAKDKVTQEYHQLKGDQPK